MKNIILKSTNKKLKIAKYTRESTREQAENGFNLLDQNKKIDLYIKALDYEYEKLELFEDAGYSAKSLNRPSMKRMICMIKNRDINMVIIHNLDRLTRRVKDLSFLLELFNEYDVDLISITEKIDTSSAMGKFFIFLIVLVAQWEQETISERTIRGMIESSNQGNYPIGGKLPLGIKRVKGTSKVEVDKEKIKIIKDIFELIILEKNIKIISKIIKQKYKIHLKSEQIINLIRNPIFNGYYEFQNKKVNLNFKVIDDETFNYANQIINSNAKERIYKYIFNNMIECSECNVLLTNNSSVKKGKVYLYYVCPKCKLRISEKNVLNIVSEELAKRLNFKKLTKTIRNLKNSLKNNKETQQKIIKSINKNEDVEININILKMLVVEETKIKEKLEQSKSISKREMIVSLSYDELADLLKNQIYKIICSKHKDVVIEYKQKQ